MNTVTLAQKYEKQGRVWSLEHPLVAVGLVGLVTLVLTLLAFAWMGYDFSLFSEQYINAAREDVLLNSWTLYQAMDNLLHRPLDLGYAPIFYGEPVPFSYTIAPYGAALLMLPLYIVSGDIELVYNTYMVLTYVLTAVAGYLLVRHLLRVPFAVGLLAALMITFAQPRLFHLEHLEGSSTFTLLFSLYALHRLIAQPGLRSALLLAVAFFFTATINAYFAYFFLFMAVVIVGFGLVWRRIGVKFFAWGVASALIGLLLCAPFLSFWLQNTQVINGVKNRVIESRSATLNQLIGGNSYLYWRIARALPRPNHEPFEWGLFLGVTPLALSAVALVLAARRAGSRQSEPDEPTVFTARQVVIIYAVLIVLGYLLAQGLRLQVSLGGSTWRPYESLFFLPTFRSIRAPFRFIHFALIGTAVLSAFVLLQASMRLPRRGYRVIVGVVALLLVIELLPSNKRFRSIEPATSFNEVLDGMITDLRVRSDDRLLREVDLKLNTDVFEWLAEQPPGTPVFHYPINNYVNQRLLQYQHLHNQPMLNGVGSQFPDWYVPIERETFPSPWHMSELEDRQIRYIIVHRNLLYGDADRFDSAWAAYEAEYGELATVVKFGEVEVYRVPDA